MNFGQALEALKQGKKVTRSIWKGHWSLSKNVSLGTYVEPTNSYFKKADFSEIIVATLVDGSFAPAQPYQQDMLAEDWQIVE